MNTNKCCVKKNVPENVNFTFLRTFCVIVSSIACMTPDQINAEISEA